MGAGGAYLRRLYAYYYMAAVAALPNLYFALFKNGGGLNIVQQRPVSFLVALFYCCDQPELHRKLCKAFLLRCFGELLIHIGPFVVFALRGMLKVIGSAAYAVKLLEPQLGMLLLVIGGL